MCHAQRRRFPTGPHTPDTPLTGGGMLPERAVVVGGAAGSGTGLGTGRLIAGFRDPNEGIS